MGLGSSRFSLLPSSKIQSKEELIAKTKDITELSDKLFTFMYTNFSPKDVWDIAINPEEYVIALSQLIEKQFDIIGYSTNRTVDGEIYFRKYKTPNPNPRKEGSLDPSKLEGEMKKEHIKNAKIIAFYFIRIFQILGALLLVVKNSSLDDMDKSPSDSDVLDRPILGQRLPRIYNNQRGGGPATSEILGPLEFLRNYLQNPTTEDLLQLKNKRDGYSLYKIRNTDIFVEYKPYTFPLNLDNINNSPPTFTIILKERSTNKIVPFSFKVYIVFTSPPTLTENTPVGYVTLRMKKDDNIPQRDFLNPRNNNNDITIKLERSETENKRYSIDFTNQSALVSQIRHELKELKGTSVNRYLEQALFSQSVVLSGGISLKFYTENKPEEDEEAPSGVSEQLKPVDIKSPVIKKTYELLLKGKTMPIGKHCIQRAEQLLSPIFKLGDGITPAYTKICKFSAPGIENDTASLEEYGPTQSLAQLFGKIEVDPEEFAKSDIVLQAFVHSKGSSGEISGGDGGSLGVEKLRSTEARVNKSEADELKYAINVLKTSFSILQEKTNEFKDLGFKKPKECAAALQEAGKKENGLKGKAILIENDNLKRQLREVSQELLAFHVNSTIEITKFLKTLFNIDKDTNGYWRVLGIKKSYLFAGFSALDKLTDQARKLLIDYYSGCEARYQEGVKIWADENKDIVPAAAVGASASSAAAPGAPGPAAAAAGPAANPAAAAAGPAPSAGIPKAP